MTSLNPQITHVQVFAHDTNLIISSESMEEMEIKFNSNLAQIGLNN